MTSKLSIFHHNIAYVVPTKDRPEDLRVLFESLQLQTVLPNQIIIVDGSSPDIKYVCDEAISKQGKFLPGSLIPIVNKKKLMITKPDVILILPWNLSREISQSLKFTKQWNCKLYVALPKLKEIR